MTTDIDHLTLRARSLPRAVDPEQDLWPAIEAELADSAGGAVDDPPVRRPHLAGLAAGFLLMGGLGFWLGSMSTEPGTGTTTLHTPMAPVSLARQSDLHAARIALSGLVEERLTNLPVASRQVVIENLAAINQALDEIDAALAGNPSTSTEQHLLMAMYSDQLALLEKMNVQVRNRPKGITL